MTDANLLLGRLGAGAPLAGGVALDARRGRARRSARSPASSASSCVACAEGIVRVADAEMVRALRVMTVEQGIDPRGFALLAFGGAGPLHAAAIADELGMTTILCPRASGVLSALGLAAADRRATRAAHRAARGRRADRRRAGAARRLADARATLAPAATLGGRDEREVEVAYDLRYRGQAHELTVRDCADAAAPTRARGVRGAARGALRLPRRRRARSRS